MSSSGKTNTPEFGLPCYTEIGIAPPARTPWDLARSAGGSSGGAAAAVAGGLAALAQGSDGGGSIRIPASVCGLVGLKPSRGRISNGPLRDAPGDLAVQGPLARTVADAAALLDVDGRATSPVTRSLDRRAAGRFPSRDRDAARIGCGSAATPTRSSPTPTSTPSASEVWQRATRSPASGLGHDVEDVADRSGPEVVGHFENVWAALATLAPVAA